MAAVTSSTIKEYIGDHCILNNWISTGVLIAGYLFIYLFICKTLFPDDSLKQNWPWCP